jgi:nucleoside-diphosphate-sugar epimerase
MNKVLVVGGTGFIGAAIVDALLANGDEVLVLCRSKKDFWQEQDNLSFCYHDIYAMQFDECVSVLRDINKIIFAAGVDERETPKGDAYEFFAGKNIGPMKVFLEAAKYTDCEQFILLNSMFSFLDRTRPELDFYSKHPYVRCRVDQRDVALTFASDDLAVNVFEIPYVFGADKLGNTQWWRLVDFSRASPLIIFTKGGANMVHVKTLANACVAATSNGLSTGCYPIGDENLTWEAMFERLQRLDGDTRSERGVFQMPKQSFDKLSRLGGFFKQLLGMQSGLDNQYMGEVITQELFFDAAAVHKEIGSEVVNLDEALQDTLDACEQKSTLKSWLDLATP